MLIGRFNLDKIPDYNVYGSNPIKDIAEFGNWYAMEDHNTANINTYFMYSQMFDTLSFL